MVFPILIFMIYYLMQLWYYNSCIQPYWYNWIELYTWGSGGQFFKGGVFLIVDNVLIVYLEGEQFGFEHF